MIGARVMETSCSAARTDWASQCESLRAPLARDARVAMATSREGNAAGDSLRLGVRFRRPLRATTGKHALVWLQRREPPAGMQQG